MEEVECVITEEMGDALADLYNEFENFLDADHETQKYIIAMACELILFCNNVDKIIEA